MTDAEILAAADEIRARRALLAFGPSGLAYNRYRERLTAGKLDKREQVALAGYLEELWGYSTRMHKVAKMYAPASLQPPSSADS